ncbi:MAG: family 20 glycosylhydrolase, partial [Kiritimatiellae bacterium]|nr:family 20 glycosylhydrolase [Kiritimatiellia bacterium]
MTLSLFAAATAATAFEMLQPRPKRIEPAGGFCRDAANVLVVTARVEGVRADLAPEAYELVVAPDGVTIRASDARGERYARTTLAQLVKLADGKAPCGAVADWPQHRWRGLMHDCGRNYLDVASIKKTLDLMAAYKYNLFHWHLTDYYGWRLESKAHPELQAPRAFRRQPMKYYTQAEFRDVLDYAAARGITVMPEMDVPSHSLALRRGLGVETMAEPRVKEAVCELIDELCSLATPEEMPFVHIGTDEARTPPEQVPDSFCPAWAARVRANGRIPVGWSPGKDITTPAGVKSAKMVWRDGFAPADDEAAFDATRLYFGSADCLALLNTAVFSKPFRFAADERRALGPVACSWHDDMLGDDTSAALRNNFFAPAIVMLSSLMWERREKDRPEFLLRLPPPGTDAFDDARRFEARIAAQRDKALAGLDMPFAFVRQTDMRWRVSDAADGRVVADDVPQGTVYVRPWSRPGQEPPDALLPCRTGCAILETWIKSATNRTVGAWIGFTHFKRSGGRNRGLPEDGEWDAVSKGITVELNDRVVPPPKWGRPGLRYIAPDLDEPTSNNIAELPFTNEEYWMREPTSLALRAGWNHVKITLPHAAEKYGYHWVSTFIPLEGTSDHPREAQGLEYASSIVSLKPGETEVVVADDAPKSVLFAVEELTNFLSRAWGRDVPVRRRPTGARAIYLGDSAWTRQAGI